jgi:hypothetical protein
MGAAREPAGAVHEHGHGVAGIIDEQLLPAQIGLAHGHGQAPFPAAIELAEPAVLVPLGVRRNVLVPENLQRDVLALQLAIDHRPIRLGLTTMAPLAAPLAVEPHLKLWIADLRRDRPRQARLLEPGEHLPQRRSRHARAPRHLLGR